MIKKINEKMFGVTNNLIKIKIKKKIKIKNKLQKK